MTVPKTCLGYEDDDWNSPVNNFYVVAIYPAPKKRNAIKKRLIRVAEEEAEDDSSRASLSH